MQSIGFAKNQTEMKQRSIHAYTAVQESEEEMGFIRGQQSLHMYSGADTYTPHAYSIYRVHPPLHKGEILKYHHLASGVSHGPETPGECAVLSATESECDSSWSDHPVI